MYINYMMKIKCRLLEPLSSMLRICTTSTFDLIGLVNLNNYIKRKCCLFIKKMYYMLQNDLLLIS